MKLPAALAASTLAFLAIAAPAFARDGYVVDNAHLLNTATVSAINQKVGDFHTQTGKEVVVDTESTLAGQTPQAFAEHVFAQQQVNGVMIFIAKAEKKIGVIPDRSAARFFPAGSTDAIRNAMRSGFNSQDFNGGVMNGVDLTLSQYRSHLGSLRHQHAYAPVSSGTQHASTGGFFNMSLIVLIIIAVVGFLIIRGIFRAMSGPRMYPPGGAGYGGGPGYGGPGYGRGGFGGGGGGGFWSGMLGGLGGAFLGNELFGGNRNFGGGIGGVNDAGMTDAGQQDAGGWQSDAGQADMGNSSFGGYGDSGGGGGWGDSGGGGGFDGGGGGGGDSGGGGW